MNVIFYDAIPNCQLKQKIDFIENLKTQGHSVYRFNQKYFFDGFQIYNFRIFLDEIKEDAIGFIWNGSEIGCELVANNLNHFGIDYCYIEQGLIPQHEHLRILNCPIPEETYLGHANAMLDAKYRNYELPLQESVDKNKICLIFQVYYDSSLHKLRNPKKDLPYKLSLGLHKRDKNKDIVLCPHPKCDINSYDLTPLKDFNYRISKKSTIEECLNANFVVGYTSTLLYETYLKGIPTISVYGNHVINHIYDHRYIKSMLEFVQFKPDLIKLDELIYKIEHIKKYE